MGRRPIVSVGSSQVLPRALPALSPDANEGRMISLAMDLVEKRLRDGSATSQETTHFLKLASTKERIELEMMRKQMELMDAKIKSYEAQDKLEDMLTEALEAFKRYSGNGDDYREN